MDALKGGQEGHQLTVHQQEDQPDLTDNFQMTIESTLAIKTREADKIGSFRGDILLNKK